MSIYEKPVKILFKDLIKALDVKKGDIVKRDQFFAWFEKNYPKIKSGTISAHLLKMSTNAPSRIHYNVHPGGNDDLLYQIDSQKFRLYDSAADPEPIYKETTTGEYIPVAESDEGPIGQSEFAYEKDLQNFLAKNLSILEPGLKLYRDEDITGIEYPVDNRRIDILALNEKNDYVVIELKVSRGYDRVVGQILRYMAWIKKYQADEGQKVRGIIIARDISVDLVLACSEINNVELYEYQMSVVLNKVKEQIN